MGKHHTEHVNMDANTFAELLKRCESETLDFKSEHYDFSGATPEDRQRKRDHFVKDIICFANTPRAEPAYILLGASRRPDGSVEAKGLATHVDDNLLQQQLEKVAYPHPRFHYVQVDHDGKRFRLIQIPSDRLVGPFLATEDMPGAGLRRNVLYWRRGSQNAEAMPEEQRAIHEWFHGHHANLPLSPAGDDDWNRFVSTADVSETGHERLLVLAPGNVADQAALANLAWIDWGLVVDF